jgi:hypothetical protein
MFELLFLIYRSSAAITSFYSGLFCTHSSLAF